MLWITFIARKHIWIVTLLVLGIAGPDVFARGGSRGGGSRGGGGARSSGGMRSSGAMRGGGSRGVMRSSGGMRRSGSSMRGGRSFSSRGRSSSSLRSRSPSRGYTRGRTVSRSSRGRTASRGSFSGRSRSLNSGFTRGTIRARSAGGTSNARSRSTRSFRGSVGRYRYLQGSRGFRGSNTQSRSRDSARVGSRRGFTRSQRAGGAGRMGSQRAGSTGSQRSRSAGRHGFVGGTGRHRSHVGAQHRGYPWVNGHYYPLYRGYWGFYYSRHHYGYPYYSYWYPGFVNYSYVPYGFYGGGTSIYINSSPYVYDDYGVVEEEPAAPGGDAEGPAEEPEAVPATSSATTEKYLREASEAFRNADYETAAKKFRLAALSSPTEAGPLFALGQSLVALKQDAYAARVIREAVMLSPEIVKQPGDITGVFKSPEEFDRVRSELESRAEKSDPGSEPRFLVAVARYFTGDARAVEDFDALAKLHPGDKAVSTFVAEAKVRFKTDKLPPISDGK